MSNRLSGEFSPYLLQHKDNPVHWQPWDSQALDESRDRQMPIFLSIGYSACHWCHVMEHESFENPHIAKLLNENFVCIKVDREERPDLDHLYMQAVQMLTGRGGWPMSVFLTPKLQPFFGGTYWPPTARMGMPGFDRVIQAVASAWRERREEVESQAVELTKYLQDSVVAASLPEGPAIVELLNRAAQELESRFDYHYGGFGDAPKFPHSMDLELLLRVYARTARPGVMDMVRGTLDRMSHGGIYDHLGGGFHRYSVDERWLVPHFEKMLYDNALLSRCYLEAFLAAQHQDYARVCQETLDYLLQEMRDPLGPIYSTEDADSEGEEGKYYVWTPEEIEQVLGSDPCETFCHVYDVTHEGNFEGRSILNLPKTPEQYAKLHNLNLETLQRNLAESRRLLLQARSKRVRPHLDDKVVTSWNGFAIEALALAAGRVDRERPRYLQAAEECADFFLTHMRDAEGRLLHTWRSGVARQLGFLDDFAGLGLGLVTLYQVSGAMRWLDEAAKLADAIIADFAVENGPGFYYTSHAHEVLIARKRELQDGSTPSGNSLAATLFAQLWHLTANESYREAAESCLHAASDLLKQAPQAACQLLKAGDLLAGDATQIVLLGAFSTPEFQNCRDALLTKWLPRSVFAMVDCSKPDWQSSMENGLLGPLLRGKELREGVTLYVCRGQTCDAPESGLASVLAAIERLEMGS